MRIPTWFSDPDGRLGRLPPALRLDPGPPRGVEGGRAEELLRGGGALLHLRTGGIGHTVQNV